MNNSVNNFIEKIKNNKKVRLAIIIVLLTILILYLFLSVVQKNENIQNENEIDLYVNSLEDKLSSVLSKLSGAGRVEVVISVESGMETVLATEKILKDTEYGVEQTEKPIIVNGKTVTLKELYPKIVGVLIVSEGANDIMVMRKIQEATVSLLNVGLEQIEILSMN